MPTLCEGAAPPEGFPFGTVLRNGPNSKYGIGKEHVFDGDGMIHGCSFLPSGKVIYFNRWVESIGYKKEKKAGKKVSESNAATTCVYMTEMNDDCQLTETTH